jgi:uncharacterized protein YcnI
MTLLAVAVPAVAPAHAVVYPKRSTPGAYEKYVLRVPNERDKPTTRVEITFPADLRVVSFGDVAGWTLEVRRDAAGRVTGASWSGTLPVERFVEFPFIAVNPRSDARLVWPAYQTYEGGERVAWTGPEDSKTPASATRIGGGDAAGGSVPLYVAIAAAAVALVSLGFVMRARGEARA